MDFHQLRIFMEVARQKSYTRAAENLFLSQPTVSIHIKKLEEELEVPLFKRVKAGFELTEAGKVLFHYGQELLATKAEALSAIEKGSGTVKGHLQIAASSVPGAYLLPGLLRDFCRLHRQVTFSLLQRDTGQVLESIRDYTCDLGFIGEPGPRSQLEQIKLAEDELILVAAPCLAAEIPSAEKAEGELPGVLLNDCLGLPFLLREPGSSTRQVFEDALKDQAASNENLRVIGYLESQEAIIEAVKAGLGLTVISARAVRDELETGLLKGYRIKDFSLKRHFYLVFRKESVLSPLSRAFFEFVRGELIGPAE